jgi:hypothetical protein
MKPRLSKTTLSLAMAMATLAGCSGGVDTGQKADTNASAFRDGISPTVRDGDKLALTDLTTDYNMALRSAALKLTGNYPTLAEIKELRDSADQPATYAARIDDYLSRPAFANQQMAFWRDTFHMGGSLSVTVNGTTTPVSLETAPAFAAQLVVEGKPFNKLLTDTKGTCPTFNAATGAFTAADCTNTNGEPVVGVLTDAGVHAQFYSSMAFRRNRWVQETFMCTRFPAESGGNKTQYAGGTYSAPWAITSISGSQNAAKPKIDFHDTSAVICANCHVTMNHQSPLFARFDQLGKLTKTIQVITPVPPNPITEMVDWLPAGEGFAWRMGQPVKDLTDLGGAIAADPELPKCVSARVWNWAMSRGDIVNDQVTLTPELAAQLAGQLTTNNWNVKTLIRQVFTSPSFVRF